MATEISFEVRYPECDQMGVVHHAVYPIWYEMARNDWFAKVGIPWAEMSPLGVNPPMVDLHLKYMKPVKYPDNVTIKTRILSYAPKKLQLEYTLFNGEDTEPSASATSFHIWTGPNGKSYNMEENLPEYYHKIEVAAASET